MSPFTKSVLDAVNNDSGGTAEALRERHGRTETITKWDRSLRKLAKQYLISRKCVTVYVGLNIQIDIYVKKI